VFAQAQFGLDVRLPDMRFAALRMAPAIGGTLAQMDSAAALAMPGVEQVLPLPAGLLAGLRQRHINPDQLSGLLGSLDGDPALSLEPLPEPLSATAPLAPQLEAIWQERWQVFRQQWQERSEALEADLAAAATELKSLELPYKPYRLKPKPLRNRPPTRVL
jgi:hypothetical protein